MSESGLPPKTSVAPFTVLEKVPWGGSKPPSDNQRIRVAQHQREEVLRACEKLAKTGQSVSIHLDRDSSVEKNRHVGLVDLLALEAGIRWYRDNTPGMEEYRRRQRITTTDVLHYICRSIAWQLREMDVPGVPSKFPGNYDAMIVTVGEIRELLRQTTSDGRKE